MSSPRPSSAHSSPKRVLPPIATETDRQFLSELQEFVSTELKRLNCPEEGPDEQRYTVYKDAFDKIINYVKAYKPLLTLIKAEYEDCIEALRKGQQNAFFLTGKVRAMAAEQTTLRNYKKRSDELDEKIAIIEADNDRLRAELSHIQKLRNSRKQLIREQTESQLKLGRKNREKVALKPIPGMSIKESCDLKCLSSYLERLQKEVKELVENRSTRFSPKEYKEELKEQLMVKMKSRDQVADENEKLKSRVLRMKTAVEVVRGHMRLKPPSSDQSLHGALTLALERSNTKLSLRSQDGSSTFEDDDPTKEKEAEMMLEYIEKFNELFHEGRYAEAALHAATSPKGILRTPEALHRFKGVAVEPGEPSALLFYCEALMASVSAAGTVPNASISLECVQCALDEDRLDLVTHWLAQDRLTCSESIADTINRYGEGHDQKEGRGVRSQCFALAQAVYARVGLHHQAAICMCRQGRVHAMLHYLQQVAKIKRKEEYLALLKECPDQTLAEYLIQEEVFLPATVLATLLRTQHYQIALKILQEIHDKDPEKGLKEMVFKDGETEEAVWLEVVASCEASGYSGEVGVELLAALSTRDALNVAVLENDTSEMEHVFY